MKYIEDIDWQNLNFIIQKDYVVKASYYVYMSWYILLKLQSIKTLVFL